MRTAIQVVGVGLVGALLIFGCSASDSDVANVAGAAGMAPAQQAGAAGNDDSAGGTSGGAGTPGASGHAPVDNDDNAGAGGACAGNYACPSVLYFSHAQITGELPISVADAADAVFTACRNSECYSAKGSATVNPNNPVFGWKENMDGGSIFLTFDGSRTPPAVVLRWNFDGEAPSDHYSLTVQAVGATEPSTIFDLQVPYTTTVSDPSLVGEGYCRHCSEISVAELSERKAK